MTSRAVPHPRWRATVSRELLWAHWGGDYVLFHRASGLTHCVNGATATLLQDVLAAPRTINEAASELAAREDAEPSADYVSGVSALIQRLEALGLVELVAA